MSDNLPPAPYKIVRKDADCIDIFDGRGHYMAFVVIECDQPEPVTRRVAIEIAALPELLAAVDAAEAYLAALEERGPFDTFGIQGALAALDARRRELKEQADAGVG